MTDNGYPANAAIQAIAVIVLNANEPPTVANKCPSPNATVQYCDPVQPNITVSASDVDSPGSDLSAVALGLPSGLSLTIRNDRIKQP